MASISQRKGRWYVQFTLVRKRRTFCVGKMSERSIGRLKTRIEDLVSTTRANLSPSPETAAWLGGLNPRMRAKLVKVGLVPKDSLLEQHEQEDTAATLDKFLEKYIQVRRDVKPLTKKKYESTRHSLVKFFGAAKPLKSITAGDATEWRLSLLGKDRLGKTKAENTVRKHTAVAKLFFGWAVDKGLIDDNPFSKLKATIKANETRYRFITREETAKVLEACPNAEWRAIVALSRFGGLRCPSEHLALRWLDVDWAAERIRVHSPKTEHHDGKAFRDIPLFPELRTHLKEIWEPGAEYVINRYRDANQNLRTQFRRIIEKAGLEPWPKLFQNLRSTRETELAETFPIHVVCKWIGNSEPVAKKHYLQVTEEHFRQALASTPEQEQLQRAAKGAAHRQRMETNTVEHPQENGLESSMFDSVPFRVISLVAEAGLEPARE